MVPPVFLHVILGFSMKYTMQRVWGSHQRLWKPPGHCQRADVKPLSLRPTRAQRARCAVVRAMEPQELWRLTCQPWISPFTKFCQPRDSTSILRFNMVKKSQYYIPNILFWDSPHKFFFLMDLNIERCDCIIKSQFIHRACWIFIFQLICDPLSDLSTNLLVGQQINIIFHSFNGLV